MAADALARTHTLNRAGEVGPDIYAEWRASTLGSITESLEQELVACNSDIGIALMYHEACMKESFD